MRYSFKCYGHQNITAKHKTTLEFTKDKEVTLNGDCIVGVGADFSLPELKKFIENKINANKKQYDKILKNEPNEDIINKTLKNSEGIFGAPKISKKFSSVPIKIIIKIDNIKEVIMGFLNTDFNDDQEIVIRKSDFKSDRTLVIGADKGACGLSRDLIGMLKEGKKKIKVAIEGK